MTDIDDSERIDAQLSAVALIEAYLDNKTADQQTLLAAAEDDGNLPAVCTVLATFLTVLLDDIATALGQDRQTYSHQVLHRLRRIVLDLDDD